MTQALAMAMVIAATVIVVGFFVIQFFKVRWSSEIYDFLNKAREAEARIQGIAVFQPYGRREIAFFEKMARKGFVVRNPLSTGGYIIADSQQALWTQDANIRAGDVVHVRDSETVSDESRTQ
jgi:hypothetical protein